MDPLTNTLETGFVMVAGLAVRFFVVLAMLALLAAVLSPLLFTADGVHRAWLRAIGFERVAGLTWRRGAYYTPVHTWLRQNARLLRVGFDDIAARVLRHVDEVTLPREGTLLRAGDTLLAATSRGRRFTVPAPIGGVVQRVNHRVLADPDAIVRDPYRRGWLLELAPLDNSYTDLPEEGDARRWFANEAARLSTALDHASGVAAADGGELLIPRELALTPEQLDELARDFLDARDA